MLSDRPTVFKTYQNAQAFTHLLCRVHCPEKVARYPRLSGRLKILIILGSVNVKKLLIAPGTLFQRSHQPWQHARLTQNYDQSRFGHLWHDGTSHS